MTKKKQLLVSLISNVFSFILQLGISFLITPILTEKVGTAAYGFIGLSNNFISYANIFTVIINSMAGRFITLELSKGNTEKANKYFSSVFLMDVFMSIIILIASIAMVINITYILKVPSELIFDVKLTFLFAFINLVLSIMSTVFSITIYAKNKLYIDGIRNIIGNIIKLIFLITVFSLFKPKIYYITLAGIVFSLFVIITNIRISKKIAPELKVNVKNYDKQSIVQLMKSGIWNSINNLGKTLLTGLDLLITNLLISPNAMGLLSIAKVIPITIENLLATIANVFTPSFVMTYSKNDKEKLVEEVNFSNKIIAFIMIVPIIGIVIYGKSFFHLWLPTKTIEEIQMIQVLSVLSMAPFIFSVNNYSLFTLDTVTNKLKRPVIATLIISVLSTVTTLLVLNYTKLGVYAVAGISSIYWSIKVVTFNNLNAAKNLDIKLTTFYKQYLKNAMTAFVIFIIFYLFKHVLNMDTWKYFIISIGFISVLGYIVSFILIFNRNEIKSISDKIIKKSR